MHDGFSFDVYDFHVFATGGTVPRGGELIRWTGNPVFGTGPVNPVFTGTRTEGFHVVLRGGEGVLLGFDENLNGNDPLDILPTGDINGFLDAADVFLPVTLRSNTALRALETSIQRSFYLSSRTEGFEIVASARTVGPADDLNRTASLGNVVLDYGVTARGLDGGMAFGLIASTGRFRRLGNIGSLGDIAGPGVAIAEFRDPIWRGFALGLPEQSIRFDYVYGFEGYDLSLGAGDLNYEIEFRFFRR